MGERMYWRDLAKRYCIGMISGVAAGVAATSALASDADAGFVYVSENCARCHAIGPEGTSPMDGAPPFRTLHENYPVDSLGEALAEGIVSGHPDMPEFVLEPDQIDAVIAYLKTLEP